MSWEKYAPTSESQLGRLSRLKAACGGEEAEAVVRRNQQVPTVPKLGDSAKPAGIAALYKDSYGGASDSAEGIGGGDDDDLGENAQKRGAQLREYARTCQAFVADIERAVYLLDTIAQQQEQVRLIVRRTQVRGRSSTSPLRPVSACWCEFKLIFYFTAPPPPLSLR